MTENGHEQYDTPLYVLIPPSPLFAAHWSIFVPDASSTNATAQRASESLTGRRIHVAGDRLNGFVLEIIHGYNLKQHRAVGSSRKYVVGCLANKMLVTRTTPPEPPAAGDTAWKDEDEGGGFVLNAGYDPLEQLCLEIPPPGPSLNKVSSTSSHPQATSDGRRKVTQVKDCQWWVRQVVELLSDRSLIRSADPDGRTLTEILDRLPKH